MKIAEMPWDLGSRGTC